MMVSATGSDKKAFSVAELVQQYPVSVGFLRNEIRRGSLRVRRFGRRIVVLKEDWDSYIQKADCHNCET
jgi:hypothetical protein